MQWRSVGMVAGVPALILASCQLVAGLEDRQVRAAADAATPIEAGSDANDPCSSVGTPLRNANAPSSPSDAVTFTAALYTVDFGFDGGVGENYGLNLDKVCTCPDKDSCVRTGDAGPACDGKNGVDQGGRAIIRLAETAGIVSESQLNTALVNGTSGALVRVDQWNGTNEDATVIVSVFSSLGYFNDAGSPPAWDGNDKWSVERGSVIGGDLTKPQATTSQAYVSGGTLVATLDFPLTISSGAGNSPVTIDLTGGYIVASIGKDAGGRYKLTGTLAGRWATKTLLTSLQIFPDTLTGTGYLCGDDVAYQALKGSVCKAADINRAQANDQGGFDCDAVAIGLHFIAREAELGELLSREAGVGACGPSYQDTCP